MCGGCLQTRIGKYGRLLGCSNWPASDYTRDVARRQRSRGRSVGCAPRLRRIRLSPDVVGGSVDARIHSVECEPDRRA